MLGLPDGVSGCLFDLDGVLTQTAQVHAAAWQEMFDCFLRDWSTATSAAFVPFDPVSDYDEYVDGKPREEGTRSFLASRGISLPEGSAADPPGTQTILGLSNRKNEIVLRRIRTDGVAPYPGSVSYVQAARAAGLRRAVVSSSANCRDVLAAAHIEDLFEVRIDGIFAEEEHLRGKPAPDTFLAGARALSLQPASAPSSKMPSPASRRAGLARSATSSVSIAWAGRGAASAWRQRDSDRSSRIAARAMIRQPEFSLDPWSLRETGLDLDRLAQTESVFALSNGHIGWRGNLDEGEPHGMPGSYLNGVYEIRPFPYSEAVYGRPESSETVINVTNGKLMRLFVDDEPFDVRYGTLLSHERSLDFRSGQLTRIAEWVSPVGGSVRVTSSRLVSFTHRAIAAVSYSVEPLEQSLRVTVQSELIANEQLPSPDGDPRQSAAVDHPLIAEFDSAHDNAVIVVHRTAESGLRVGAGMDHWIDGPGDVQTESRSFADGGLVTASAVLQPGQRLRIVKLVAYGWSSARSLPAIRDQVWAALSGAQQAGWDGVTADQRAYLDDFWDRADVEVDGDMEIQQAVRFGLFHVLQAGARGEDRPIAAKGLTGPGYDGHTFWDTETFVLPLLTLNAPDAVASALRWRHSTLPAARQRASQLGLAGAAFPWRTIAGQECSGYWPPARQHSISTPTSLTRSSATWMSLLTRASDASKGWSCSWRPLGSGGRLATTMTRAGSTSTESPDQMSTARSPTTTSIQT